MSYFEQTSRSSLILLAILFCSTFSLYIAGDAPGASRDTKIAQEGQNKPSGRFLKSAGNDVLNPLRAPEPGVIVLDPGHGGRDRGVVGIGGILEKIVTLDFARSLRLSLESKGYEVYLTRHSDEFLSLKSRSQIANQKDADLFITIHANTSRDTGRNGIGMGALSISIPGHKWSDTSKGALETLQYEGYSDEELTDMDWVPEQIRGSRFTSDSLRMTSNLKTCFKSEGLVLDKRFLTEAPFAVLKDARMPAFMLEVGYLSNERDFKLLTRDSSRQKLANSISTCLLGLNLK